MEQKDPLTEAHVQIIRFGEALTKDYFYIPIFRYTEYDQWDEEDTDVLMFQKDGRLIPDAYAGKVDAGETLWQAVRRDLGNDFDYPVDRSFAIEHIELHDSAQNKAGVELGRVLAYIDLDERLDVKTAKPLGLQLSWQKPAH